MIDSFWADEQASLIMFETGVVVSKRAANMASEMLWESDCGCLLVAKMAS